jgi:putative sigma-54 modulation protein
MRFTVTGRNIEITDGIRDHLLKKMSKTIHELEDDVDVHVALAVEKRRHFAEVTIKAPGFNLHSEEETIDLYASMDNALVKIERQLRKHKDRAKDLKIKQGGLEKEKLHSE